MTQETKVTQALLDEALDMLRLCQPVKPEARRLERYLNLLRRIDFHLRPADFDAHLKGETQ